MGLGCLEPKTPRMAESYWPKTSATRSPIALIPYDISIIWKSHFPYISYI